MLLKDFEMGQKTDRETRRTRLKACRDKLTAQQLSVREKKLPVLVLLEGWDAAGKGGLLNEMLNQMDPRFFKSYALDDPSDEDRRKPFLWRYAIRTPERGEFAFFDTGWLNETVDQQMSGRLDGKRMARRIEEINIFERQLTDDGMLLVKIFLNITRREQAKRLDRLDHSKDTAWRVSAADRRQNCSYGEYRDAFDSLLSATDTPAAPWILIDSTDKGEAKLAVMEALTGAIEAALSRPSQDAVIPENRFRLVEMPKLAEIPLGRTIDPDTYKSRLDAEQHRLCEMHNRLYLHHVPLILVYEGWDAAGKGGSIRRVAEALDPRGYEVQPIAAPEKHELAHHYLWRFWTRLPKDGHVTIFDRSWYGRVMVERIEGFCTQNQWQRAYNEINEFEDMLTSWGAVILKFWVQIDSDTQLARFQARQQDAEKQWKITDEDWRNRDKWPQYEEAVNDMLQKTSTLTAPWYIIESVDKKYARIRTLELITGALEKVL